MQAPKLHHLDSLIASYRDRPLQWKDVLLFFLPAALATLAPWLYGTWRIQYAQARFGPAAAQQWGWNWYTLSAIALISLLGLALCRLQRAHRKVDVYQNGLYIQGTLGEKHIFLWRQVTGIASATIQYHFLGFRLQTRHQLTIFSPEGKAVTIDSRIKNANELSARIKAKIYPKLLVQARLQLRDGNEVPFGPLALMVSGIKIRGRFTAWEQVSRIHIQQGFLMVEFENSKTQKVAVREIPNIEIFLQLISEEVSA